MIWKFEDYKNIIEKTVFDYLDSICDGNILNLINYYKEKSPSFSENLDNIMDRPQLEILISHWLLWADSKVENCLKNIADAWNRPYDIYGTPNEDFSDFEKESLKNGINRLGEITSNRTYFYFLVRSGSWNSVLCTIVYNIYKTYLPDFIKRYSNRNNWDEILNPTDYDDLATIPTDDEDYDEGFDESLLSYKNRTSKKLKETESKILTIENYVGFVEKSVFDYLDSINGQEVKKLLQHYFNISDYWYTHFAGIENCSFEDVKYALYIMTYNDDDIGEYCENRIANFWGRSDIHDWKFSKSEIGSLICCKDFIVENNLGYSAYVENAYLNRNYKDMLHFIVSSILQRKYKTFFNIYAKKNNYDEQIDLINYSDLATIPTDEEDYDEGFDEE